MPRKPAAPEDLSAKKALALEVIARLKKEYPDAACTLDYDHAWQLLVSVRLAAQCTDARVNIVVEDLFAKYPSVAALAAAEPEEIEAIVKPCGLGHSKARDISACMRMLRDKYDCKVPTTFEELLSLPGVGRKSANLIMGDVFGKPAIVTDLWMALRNRRKWRWPCGRSFRRKRAVICATALSCMAGPSAMPASRSAKNAACVISAATPGRMRQPDGSQPHDRKKEVEAPCYF